MTLAAQIVADVPTVFFNTSDFAVAITYTRGSNSASLVAIVSDEQAENLTDLGATRIDVRTYQIEASTLDLGNGLIKPMAGDLITEGSSVFIVPKSAAIPRWSYADEDRLILRVNTTLKSET